MGVHLILSHQTSGCRANSGGFSSSGCRELHTQQNVKKKLFVNSCCLADPGVIFPWRAEYFTVNCSICVCLTKQSMLRVSPGCSSCCVSAALLYRSAMTILSFEELLCSHFSKTTHKTDKMCMQVARIPPD